ncbi:flippase [Desulfurobacterium sp.]|uniref:flippase n=1 Tax=Desulfurobacterium sp. TaxID=2004706 RepID=UPI002604716D|nr:flippase [Desulfurobacterium sp.]
MITRLKRKLQSKLNSDIHFAELVKGAGTAFGFRILGIVFGYLFTLLVTRTLSARAWGIFALCLVVLQISSVVGRLGMDTALLRFTAEYTAKERPDILKGIYKKALTLVIPFSIMVAVSVYFISPVLASAVFKKPYLTPYFHIISFAIVPFVLLWIHRESIRGLKKIKQYMLLQQTGISGIALILFTAGIYLIGRNVELPIFSYVTAIVVLSIIAFLMWKKYLYYFCYSKLLHAGESPVPCHSERSEESPHPLRHSEASCAEEFLFSYKALLSVSIPMLLSSSLALIMGWTDTVMLGMFRSAQEVGVYNVALRVSMITSITLMAINTIAAPKFAEFWGKGDIKGLAKVAQQSTKLIFWTSFPILLLFLIFPKPILGIFGEEFKAGAVALMILTIGQFVNVTTGSVGYLLNMTSYEKIIFGIWTISAVIVVLANLILVPFYGINGAAFSTLLSHIWSSLAALIFVRRKLGFWNLPYVVRRKNC